MAKPSTILFIHGMFMNKECWNDWVSYFQDKGFQCVTPSWPFHEGDPLQLRNKHPNNELGKLTLTDVVGFHANIIKEMGEPPILIGHSMGGLVVQLLLNNGLGACGIAIDPAPPVGVFAVSWSFLKANLPTINPLKGNAPDLLTFERFQYAFTNGMTMEEQKAAYEKYVVPESRNVPRSSTMKAGRVDFSKPHNPLLLIAGGNDHIIPPGLNKNNFKKYKNKNSRTDFKEFPGRTHSIIVQKNWQEVAEYTLSWIQHL
ncbi:MAG: alpha/beta hydrolase [Bacteroidota bacterium]|nr:alpha/beta hydrolase [Bacteroidota bacterium]